MTLEELIQSLHEERRDEFVAWHDLPATPAQFRNFPASLDSRLTNALAAQGIERPYSHQAEAIDAAIARHNVVVVTPTASGKTLCYNLPVLQSILDEPESRALYLFPTKALAQDQLDEVHGLITEAGVNIKTFTYDGDTPGDARRKVREAGHIVVTNPDMLHTGILPHHTKWIKLFENLRYVIIDELHMYRGVFGSHVANLLRRLQRVAKFYGGDRQPTFICCSATIANPRELAERLVGQPFIAVDKNGAPRGRKVVALYNPPVVNAELGIRQSVIEATRQVAARLLKAGVQTIVFARSRMRVELLLRYLREAAPSRFGEPPLIEGYRGGYLPTERRSVERRLRDGSLRGVVTTNALELGIDIGSLQASVLAGYPGSLASAWQQMGRAGRRSGVSFAILVTSSTPLNQFVAQHPDYIVETPPETARIDPDNLLVRINHVKCAAFELPFEETEEFGPHLPELLEMLCDEEVLVKSGSRYHWMAESFPAEAVSLRTAALDNFVIIEQGPKPRVIGEVDRNAAPLLIHDEAIYMHGATQYHVDRLDWEEKKAYVRRVDVDYYTDANLAVELEVLDTFDRREAGGGIVAHGEVAVKWLATIFKKLKLFTNENIGWGKIHLPEENRHTTAYWLTVDDPTPEDPEDPEEREKSEDPEKPTILRGNPVQEGLSGIAHLLRHLAPIFLMCDPRDLTAVPQVRSPYTDKPTVFLCENQPGGVGMAARLFDIHSELLQAALEVVSGCACQHGCPGCVGPPVGSPGDLGLGGSPTNKPATVKLLGHLLHRAARVEVHRG